MRRNQPGWIALFVLATSIVFPPESHAKSVDNRARYATVGLTGGYALFKDKYGDPSTTLNGQKVERIEKNHWYGGAIGGIDAGLMWPVARRLDLGARLKFAAGYLKGACESVACGMCIDSPQDEICEETDVTQKDCICQYERRFTMLGSISAVLAIPIKDWLWLEAQFGLFLWIDGDSFALEPHLFGGGAIGFKIVGNENASLFYLVEFNGARRINDDWGIIPQATLGVRF